MPTGSDVFRVETTFHPDTNFDSPKVKDSIHRINLMVFLLDGVEYKDLFTQDFGLLVTGLMMKVGEAFDKGLVTKAEQETIQTNAKLLADALSGQGLTLQAILTTDKDQLPKDMWTPSEAMHDAGVSLPYLGQTPAQKGLAKKLFDKGFLNPSDDPSTPGAGDMTERKIYTTQGNKYPKVHALLMEARAASVLDTKANDMACLNGVCVTFTDLYCSMENGTCTLASDPYP